MNIFPAALSFILIAGPVFAAEKIMIYKMTEAQCKAQGGRVVGDYPPVCRDDEISLGMVQMMCPCACCVQARGPRLKSEKSSKELLRELPVPDEALIKSIRDIQLWRNPQLIIRADGVDVFYRSKVPAQNVLIRLSTLPVDAWPYGRAVAISEQSVLSKGDGPKIQRNLKKVLELLKEVGIHVERFPSA